MPPFSRCLALINTRSGAREGRSVFASALQQYLDKAGILHRDVFVPEFNVRHALLTHLPSADTLIVCGGDGTISSVANVLAAAHAESSTGGKDGAKALVAALLSKPIALVPTGLQNSIAHSLGVSSAERSVSQFVMGRVDAVPVWAVRLDGRPLRYVCASLSIGTYARAVSRYHTLDAVGDEYVALPSLGPNKYRAAAFYTAVAKPEEAPCSVELTLAGTDGDESGEARVVRYAAPLRMLLASQMPLQHGGYSLTPQATYRRGRLAVTVATADAGRLRMWHLLRNEAKEGCVLQEDGVSTHAEVEKLTLTFAAAPSATPLSNDCNERDGRENPKHEKREDDAQPSDTLMLLDGEEMRVPAGSVVTVERLSDCSLPFLIC